MTSFEIVKLIALINGNNDSVCLFLGAGADVSSGGLLFNDLKNKIIDKFSEYSSQSMSWIDRDKLFEKLIDSSPQYNSREVFQSEINGETHLISDSYKILLLLLQHKVIGTIITTNYFDYLEETKEKNQCSEFDIFTNEISKNTSRDRERPVYIKLHGDAKRHKITHVTSAEIDEKPYDPDTMEEFISHIKGQSIVFIGYSGNDSVVTKTIKDHIDQIKLTYWISPKESNSPLVNSLKEAKKYYYCNATFDDFMINWGITKLYNIKQNDPRPFFISSLLKAKAKQSTNKICKQYKHNIEREEIENKLNAINHVGFIFGRSGIGKTAVLKNYICSQNNNVLYIDLKNSSSENVLESIVSALGFSSDSPFSLLHRICLWFKSQKQYFTFIIDGIDEFNRSVEDIILLTKLNEENDYVSFIYSSRLKYNNTVCTLSISQENMIEITAFNQQEIKQMLTMNKVQNSFTKEYMLLMQEPYICAILCEHYSNNTLNNEMNVFETIEIFLEKKYNCKRSQINNLFINVAASECLYETKKALNSDSMQLLCGCGLLESNGIKFKYKKMTQYYLSLYFSKTKMQKQHIINKIEQDLNNSNIVIDNNVYCAYKLLFTNCGTIKEVTDSVLELNCLLDSNSAKVSMPKIKFVRECIFDIIHENEEKFTSAITMCSIDKLSDDIKYIIVTSAKIIKSDDNAYKIWGHFLLDDKLAFCVFIFYSDRLCEKLLNYSDVSEVETCFNNAYKYISNKGKIYKTIIILYCFMKFDVSYSNYKVIVEYLLTELNVLLNSNREECVSLILDTIRKYSYNVLFNSDSDIESDYSHIPFDENYNEIINRLEANNTITENQLCYLAQNENITNNMILFLLYNLTIVYSMKVNKDETLCTINKLLNKNKDLYPENIDFILSCSFMALYHDNPVNRNDFVNIFDKVCQLYETKMFEQPSIKRHSTSCKFSEEFDKIFEDGFNPTAFLFYTAPIDKTGDALKKYDEFCSILWKSGNHNKILKIVHSVGQMISVYPQSGFSELKKLLKYNEPIIRRGIIRALAENLQRFPMETISFMNDSQIELSNNDLLSIWGSPIKFVENRTFEQLHWSRLLYTLSLNNKDLIRKILDSSQESVKLSDFISLLFDD